MARIKAEMEFDVEELQELPEVKRIARGVANDVVAYLSDIGKAANEATIAKQLGDRCPKHLDLLLWRIAKAGRVQKRKVQTPDGVVDTFYWVSPTGKKKK